MISRVFHFTFHCFFFKFYSCQILIDLIVASGIEMVFMVVALFSFYLCCCHGRQLFVEDHPHHALHPASNSLARLSSLVRLARLRTSATSMLHTIQYFRKSLHILQVPDLIQILTLELHT